MKKLVYFIPAILFTILYGIVAISNTAAVSPIVIAWLVLYYVAGILLSKYIFWGSVFGVLPAIHLMYMGTQETGQVISETPIGIVVLLFYVVCGYAVYNYNREGTV